VPVPAYVCVNVGAFETMIVPSPKSQVKSSGANVNPFGGFDVLLNWYVRDWQGGSFWIVKAISALLALAWIVMYEVSEILHVLESMLTNRTL